MKGKFARVAMGQILVEGGQLAGAYWGESGIPGE